MERLGIVYWLILAFTAASMPSLALPHFERSALQREIDAVATRGGGVVRVEAGEHEVSPFVLRSNVTLELAEGAVLLASTNRADYPMPPGSKYFIFAEGATNVAIRVHAEHKEGDDIPCKEQDEYIRRIETVGGGL